VEAARAILADSEVTLDLKYIPLSSIVGQGSSCICSKLVNLDMIEFLLDVRKVDINCPQIEVRGPAPNSMQTEQFAVLLLAGVDAFWHLEVIRLPGARGC
jgi:hypothetical protein